MPGKDIRVPGDKLEIEGVVQSLCDEYGRHGIRVEDINTLNEYGEPTSHRRRLRLAPTVAARL
jgi:hypothetical protein